MQAIVVHAVGRNVCNLELVSFEFGNLYIGRKDGSHQGHLVTFIKKEILFEGIEDVAHCCSTAFGGEKVKLSLWRTTGTKFLCKIVASDNLCEFEYAVGHRILITDDTLGPLVHKFVGVYLVLGEHIFVTLCKKFTLGSAAILVEKLLEAFGNAILLRNTCNAIASIEIEFTLGNSKFSEEKKCLARQRSYPIGVSASCVEHHIHALLYSLVGKLYQSVF